MKKKQKFLFSKKNGSFLHFYCSKKETLKCKAKATVYATENPVEYSVVNFDKEHNHESLEGPVVADLIQAEMKQEYEKNFRRNPSEIKKEVLKKYKLKYR